MILAEFAKFLQKYEDDIVKNKSTVKLLGIWLKEILKRKPKTNVEKIVHAEISLAVNNVGDYFMVAKSETGRKLTQALYNFALSFEQHVLNKWLQDKRPSDFNNNCKEM